ncbi:MAG: HalOD1 output domain-containing protein [Haloarculaceae archaeon]
METTITNETTSTRVVQAVAEAKEVDPTDLPPLYDVVSPDALDALFDPPDGERRPSEYEFRFAYAGRNVVIRNDRITVA